MRSSSVLLGGRRWAPPAGACRGSGVVELADGGDGRRGGLGGGDGDPGFVHGGADGFDVLALPSSILVIATGAGGAVPLREVQGVDLIVVLGQPGAGNASLGVEEGGHVVFRGQGAA